MIVHEMADGQLLCINQMTHGLMAAAFCRRWGNQDFAPPIPYEAVMIGIAQHDCGWYDWEQAPELRPDGYPMDFLHGPVGIDKLNLWQDGIDRVYLQHPYAGLVVGQHAAWMHAELLHTIPEDERYYTQTFIDAQSTRIEATRNHWKENGGDSEWLDEASLVSNTRLLQFGDTASLQVSMPWSDERTFPACPLDHGGDYVPIRMRHDGQEITFDPWPFGSDSFVISVHGKLLSRRTFPDHETYHTALASAPFAQLNWTVFRSN